MGSHRDVYICSRGFYAVSLRDVMRFVAAKPEFYTPTFAA